ncbi:MAG: hypothetical protein V3V16_10640 [Melioribacteraceae bacterium]
MKKNKLLAAEKAIENNIEKLKPIVGKKKEKIKNIIVKAKNH